MTIVNTHYLPCRHHTPKEAVKILMKFKVLVEVLALNDKIINLALSSNFKDFEDAVQYFTAIENKTDMIITRNKKDFTQRTIPVFTAKEYLNNK